MHGKGMGSHRRLECVHGRLVHGRLECELSTSHGDAEQGNMCVEVRPHNPLQRSYRWPPRAQSRLTPCILLLGWTVWAHSLTPLPIHLPADRGPVLPPGSSTGPPPWQPTPPVIMANISSGASDLVRGMVYLQATCWVHGWIGLHLGKQVLAQNSCSKAP